MYLNRISLIGFTGSDAEARYTQAGKPVTNFSLATNKRWKEANGKYQSSTQWHRCVVYGALAEYAAKLGKGSHLMVEGELRTREYEREVPNGKKTLKVPATVAEILVRSVIKLDRSAKPGDGQVPEADETADELAESAG